MLKKHRILVLTLVLALTLIAGAVQATEVGEISQVCLSLDQNISGVSSLDYNLSMQYLGNDHYLIAGHITATMPAFESTIKRAVCGSAVVDGQTMEISLQDTDIHDLAFTGEIESLHVAELHLVVDKDTFSGNFQLVNTSYAMAGDEATELRQKVLSGTVSKVDCQ